MSLIFLVGLQLRQPALHFLGVRFMRFEILFMSAPLFHEASTAALVSCNELFRLTERRFDRMKTFGDLSALVGDLHDTEIQFLQFDEGRQILVQCTPIRCYPEGNDFSLPVRRSTGGPTRTRT